jgi:hypothetical protein
MSELDEFWNDLDHEALKQVQGWEFDRDGELIYFSLAARDGERYRVRIQCDGYRARAPDPVFVDNGGSKTTVSAWPRGDGDLDQYIKPPPHCFVCMPWSRGGLERHGDWVPPAVEVWDPAKHSLLDLCNFFQRLLNSQHYSGRRA